MINRLGENFTDFFRKNMPDAFVFALILTIITSICAVLFVNATFIEIIDSWYKGFWMLLEFGMQMILLIATGYTIAISPLVGILIDRLSKYIKTPNQVYFFVTLFGLLVSMISWGWIVVAAAFARSLAERIKGINYPFLIACTYISNGSWVTGLSSSIPLLLNTQSNYLIEAGILNDTISTGYTLGSILNISVIFIYLFFVPLLILLIKPKKTKDLSSLLITASKNKKSVEQEALDQKLPFWAISDKLNNSFILNIIIALMGLTYITRYFFLSGFDLNLNIMIFIFLFLGLILHKSPLRYGIAMQRTSSNISSLVFQFPFYAGIMGIMIYTGLGASLAQWIAEVGTVTTYPIYAFILGGIVNFAIPSGGGEFAVIGPSILEAVKTIGYGLTSSELIEMMSRASLAVAYGESLTNLLQPFYLLLILPIMGVGTHLQARDVMGYLVVPFLILFIIYIPLLLFIPL